MMRDRDLEHVRFRRVPPLPLLAARRCTRPIRLLNAPLTKLAPTIGSEGRSPLQRRAARETAVEGDGTWISRHFTLSQRCSYSGLSPSASNCPLHSVGGSRSRSIPMPRGRRSSTAALIGHLAPGFWSLQAFTFFRHDFWRFVSASKNFVPGGWVLGRRMPRTCTAIPPFGPR